MRIQNLTSKWYNLHPNYTEHLLKEAAKDKVFIENRLIEVVDAEKVIKEGCVYSTQVYKGEICVITNICSLAFSSCIDVIKCYFDKYNDRSLVSSILNTYFNDGKSEAIKKLYSQKIKIQDFSVIAVIAHRLLGETDWARSLLEEFKPGSLSALHEPIIMLEIARTWKHLFNDDEECKRYINAAAESSILVEDLVNCAKANIELLGNETEACQLMIDAENEATTVMQWLYCAEAWNIYFDNSEATKKCVDLAKKSISACYEFFDFINALKLIYNDIERVKEELIEIEHIETHKIKILGDFECMKDLIGIWIALVDKQEAADALLRIQALSNDASHHIACAKLWMIYFNNEKKSKASLISASESSTAIKHFIECAEAWLALLKESDQATQCLIEAEKVSISIEDWLMLAVKWKELFNDKERSEKCIFEAKRWEKDASNASAWLSIAKIWQNFRNHTEARRCLLKAWADSDNFNILMDCLNLAQSLFKYKSELLYSDWGKAFVLKAWKYADNSADLLKYINSAKDLFKGNKLEFKPDDCNKLHWHKLHHIYRNYLLAVARKDIVFVEDEIIYEVNVIELINNGCVYTTKLYRDELCVVTDLKSLIFSKSWFVLEQYLQKLNPDKNHKHYFLWLFFDAKKGRVPDALKVIQDKKSTNIKRDEYHSIDIETKALIYNSLYSDNESLVEECLPGYLPTDIYGYNNIVEYVQSAKVSRLILKNPQLALEYLGYANDDIDVLEDFDHHFDEFMLYITHSIELFNDDLNGFEILSRAFDSSIYAEEFYYHDDDIIMLCKLAEFWKKYYNDDEEASKCLRKAEYIYNNLEMESYDGCNSGHDIINNYWIRLFTVRQE